MAHLHTAIDPATGAIDLERLIVELEQRDLERRRDVVRHGRRGGIAFLDFDGERWLYRRRVAVLRAVLQEQHVRAAGAGDGGAASARPLPAGRLDVGRHPVEHVLVQPLEHADRDGVLARGAEGDPQRAGARSNPGAAAAAFDNFGRACLELRGRGGF